MWNSELILALSLKIFKVKQHSMNLHKRLSLLKTFTLQTKISKILKQLDAYIESDGRTNWGYYKILKDILLIRYPVIKSKGKVWGVPSTNIPGTSRWVIHSKGTVRSIISLVVQLFLVPCKQSHRQITQTMKKWSKSDPKSGPYLTPTIPSGKATRWRGGNFYCL